MGSVRVAEHLKVKEFPAIPGPEGEIVTWLVLYEIPKFTGHAMEEKLMKQIQCRNIIINNDSLAFGLISYNSPIFT